MFQLCLLLHLAMCPLAIASRFIRTEMIDVFSSDYITLARAKGASSFEIAFKHGLTKCSYSTRYSTWTIDSFLNNRITCY